MRRFIVSGFLVLVVLLPTSAWSASKDAMAVWPRPEYTYNHEALPHSVDHLALGFNKLWAKNYKGAQNEFEYNLTHFGPRSRITVMSLRGLSELAMALGRPELATSWYEQVLAKAPSEPVLWEGFGAHLYRFGRHQEAIEAFQKAEKLGGAPAVEKYNLALCYLALDDREEVGRLIAELRQEGLSDESLRDLLEAVGPGAGSDDR